MVKSSLEILRIGSHKAELHKVEAFVKNFFRKNQISFNEFNKVFLCISEAVINSIEHGNRNVLDKKIVIEIKRLAGDIEVTVNDEGDGFDIENIDDPTTKKNIQRESGRGIHIIKTLSKKIGFNEKGNSIQFKIKC